MIENASSNTLKAFSESPKSIFDDRKPVLDDRKSIPRDRNSISEFRESGCQDFAPGLRAGDVRAKVLRRGHLEQKAGIIIEPPIVRPRPVLPIDDKDMTIHGIPGRESPTFQERIFTGPLIVMIFIAPYQISPSLRRLLPSSPISISCAPWRVAVPETQKPRRSRATGSHS